jgi:redox-sensitive bicupin YhaK (pirin superfamily)
MKPNAKDKNIDVRRAESRFHTQIGWLDSWHSFSFGEHFDPENRGHGLLLVNNDDIVTAGAGFGMHPHKNMEIVTWVLSGELEHKDSAGNHGKIYPGLAQRMSAGSGIYHSEMNASKEKDVRLVQMWVHPDTLDIQPGYEQMDISAELKKGGLVPIASGKKHKNAVTIHQKDAVLWGGRLQFGEIVTVPDARHVHVFAAVGSADLEGAGELKQGDAVRLTAAGPLKLTGHKGGAEVLIWETA